MTSVRENYCLDCDWSASVENHDREELAALAIEHAVETGHDIDSISGSTNENTAHPSA